MNILSQHWEKVAISVALIALVAISIIVALSDAEYKTEASTHVMRDVALPENQEDIDFSALENEFVEFALWTEPASTHRMVVSRPIEFLPEKGLIKVYDAQATDKYGIPREWKTKYGLSLADPFIGIVDSDADGFLNKDEFDQDTAPTDQDSTPPHISKLRIVDSEKIPFRMIFRAYNEIDGQVKYQLNFKDAKDRRNRSPFVVTGDVIEEWKVGEFRKKVETRFDPAIQMEREFDDSELDLQHTVTNDTVTLVMGKEVDSPESVLTLRDLSAGPASPVISARISRNFDFRGNEYVLLSTRGDGDEVTATVQQIASGARDELRTPLDYELEWISRTAPAEPEEQQEQSNENDFIF